MNPSSDNKAILLGKPDSELTVSIARTLTGAGIPFKAAEPTEIENVEPDQAPCIILAADPEMKGNDLNRFLFNAIHNHQPIRIIGSPSDWEELMPIEMPELQDIPVHDPHSGWEKDLALPLPPSESPESPGPNVNVQTPLLLFPLADLSNPEPPPPLFPHPYKARQMPLPKPSAATKRFSFLPMAITCLIMLIPALSIYILSFLSEEAEPYDDPLTSMQIPEPDNPSPDFNFPPTNEEKRTLQPLNPIAGDSKTFAVPQEPPPDQTERPYHHEETFFISSEEEALPRESEEEHAATPKNDHADGKQNIMRQNKEKINTSSDKENVKEKKINGSKQAQGDRPKHVCPSDSDCKGLSKNSFWSEKGSFANKTAQKLSDGVNQGCPHCTNVYNAILGK